MRRTLTAATIVVLGCAVWLAAPAARAQAVLEDEKYQRAFDEAVDKGLAFLARSQAADGSIGGPTTPAITSLAVMAFLARGYSPGVPPHGDVMNRGIDHILSIAKPNGLLMGHNGRMYSHCIATLMLSEVSGMVDPERQARIDEVLPRALRIILAAQEVPKGEGHAGGWRYEPSSGDSDISMAGWALSALRSSRNNGAPVPKEAMDKAVKYILRCRVKEGGGFAYQPGGGPNLARTGIGLLCLELAGRHRDEVTLAAGKYIAGRFKNESSLGTETEQYYALYYLANGMFQLGGPEWEAFAPRLYDSILRIQGPDGAWPLRGGYGPNTQYATSMAILALSVSYRQLPIYQR